MPQIIGTIILTSIIISLILNIKQNITYQKNDITRLSSFLLYLALR